MRRHPSAVVVIPARAGSKGVPRKNLQRVGGRTLVRRAVEAARAASTARLVVVTTDGDAIAREAEAAGADVVRRPTDLAGDLATSESAVLHALGILDERGSLAEVSQVVLVQATSPFLEPGDIDGVVAAVASGADCALTATSHHGFLWTADGAGPGLAGINHDSGHRARRQDRPTEWLETGGAYAMTLEGFLRTRHRFFGHIEHWPVPPVRSMEIDTPEDLQAAQALAEVVDQPRPASQPRVPAGLKAVVMDFDGVLTDDSVLTDTNGVESVRCSRRDGMGLSLLRRAGWQLAILSSEANPVVAARGRKLGIETTHGIGDKGRVFRDWCATAGLHPSEVCFVGNDVNDLDALTRSGFGVVPADAHPAAAAAASLTLALPGGNGAVRELADLLLNSSSATHQGDNDMIDHDNNGSTGRTMAADRPDGSGNAFGGHPLNAVPDTPPVRSLGDAQVGAGNPVYVIAEIGINHNGSLDAAIDLMEAAKFAGADAVKFQKRTPELCVPPEQQQVERDTPWGRMTYLDYRHRVEFGRREYDLIAERADELGLAWFASPWDVEAAAFLGTYDLPAIKIASACLTDDELVKAADATGLPVMASTGMSTPDEIRHAVSLVDRDRLLLAHTTSTYPCAPDELNLRMIHTLAAAFPDVPIGYSGHEVGLQTTVTAVSLGATFVERHITLDRAMWGSDQAASVEPMGFYRLVRDIRTAQTAMGDGTKVVYDSELPIKAKLRRVG